MRRLLALAFVLCAPATAAAQSTQPVEPAADLAADGTAAVAFPGADGLQLSVGMVPGTAVPGTASAQTVVRVQYGLVSGGSRSFGVAAEPGGGARLIWVRRTVDAFHASPRFVYQVVASRPGVTEPEAVSPVLDAEVETLSVATAPD